VVSAKGHSEWNFTFFFFPLKVRVWKSTCSQRQNAGVRSRSSDFPKLCDGHLCFCPRWDIGPSCGRVPAQAGCDRGFPMPWVRTCNLPFSPWEGPWKHVHTRGMTRLVNIPSPPYWVRNGPSWHCSKAAMAGDSHRWRCACHASGRDGTTEERPCLAFAGRSIFVVSLFSFSVEALSVFKPIAPAGCFPGPRSWSGVSRR